MGIIETAKELISGIKILSSSYSKDHIALLETKGRILYELVEETAAENEKLKAVQKAEEESEKRKKAEKRAYPTGDSKAEKDACLSLVCSAVHWSNVVNLCSFGR